MDIKGSEFVDDVKYSVVCCLYKNGTLDLCTSDHFDPLIDDPEIEGKCSVVIALMQDHRRSQRHLGVKPRQIGFIIYQVTYLPEKCLPDNMSIM